MAMTNLQELSKTPYLAGLQSIMLLTTPVISPATVSPSYVKYQPVLNASTLSTIKNYLYSAKYIGPTNKSCYLFGAALAMGTGMLVDKDIENGSGFVSAWSALYLIASSRGSIKAVAYGKVWPLLLSGIACINSLAYGKRYVSCQFK
ncbi:hypothetical protein TPHA_0G00770 [Tetrapisispora phaffii CBS 4417]|uniref:Altered inheritance of mitochondria protein 19 homolog n=1 Tax=Tetrapisispora phaffii (strain ATCC 24235 / CBS 4417 / NBRC 1672 / NRRL Y-8282 / UCD 70-5) TaxID=1071381 RepID=G8BVI5_TETPH|nr:hypothetical protein TPHA_0G00770 [Tetrapisispora phaffii CBS 4417]CCE63913.1 hypothetical protein TPHA_0G00770 [Tetrapisispora phaffii CBS 4417]